MLFVGGRREQYDPGRSPTGIILRQSVFEIFIEVRFEFLQAFVALEGFVVAEECKNHVGLGFLQPVIRGTEILRAMPGHNLIARDGEIANDKFMLRIFCVKKRLEITGV